jgi:hypothetical protein
MLKVWLYCKIFGSIYITYGFKKLLDTFYELHEDEKTFVYAKSPLRNAYLYVLSCFEK